MAHGDARYRPGHRPVLDVQVTGADAGQRYPDNGVTVILQDWFRPFHQLKISLGKIGFQFVSQFLPPIFIDIKRLVFCAHHDNLLFLHRESRINEQNGVFFRIALAADQKRGIRPLHRSCNGHASFRADINIYKRFDETGGFCLYFLYSVYVGIGGGYSVFQGGYFGIYADLGRF